MSDENNRFVDDGLGARITHNPQCVECAHNLGLFDCKIYGEKPGKYISNDEICPELSV
jgi:hypothetical protein